MTLSLSLITQGTLELCNDLGLLVNLPKSEPNSLQIIDFVGVLYDLSIDREFPPMNEWERSST